MVDEYIRKQDAVDAVDAATQDSTENRTHSFRAGQARSASRIKALPAADVVPVVRCRDCKHLVGTFRGKLYCRHNCGIVGPKENDFCSRGERKE